MKASLQVGLVALAGVLLSQTALATKPCAPALCGADDAECWEQHATWVAVGRITDVARRPHGMPLMKDFADFGLRVDSWEKTHGERKPEHLSMQVGWCSSRKQLPKDTIGTFRFYGRLMAQEADDKGRVAVDYITFQRVDCPKSTPCDDAPIEVPQGARPRHPSPARPSLVPLSPEAAAPSVPQEGTEAQSPVAADRSGAAAAESPTPPSRRTLKEATHQTIAGPTRCGCRLPGGAAPLGAAGWFVLVLGATLCCRRR